MGKWVEQTSTTGIYFSTKHNILGFGKKNPHKATSKSRNDKLLSQLSRQKECLKHHTGLHNSVSISQISPHLIQPPTSNQDQNVLLICLLTLSFPEEKKISTNKHKNTKGEACTKEKHLVGL